MLPSRMHDVVPREALDRVVFVLVFFLGAGGIIALKKFGFPPLWVAIYAAVMLVFYAIFAWAGGRIRIESETIGDNCYYLGFLFTLASLSYTLYQVVDSSGASSASISIPEVISGFGIALSSTIVGVFLRVLMMQFRTDFTARDREVRADVTKAFLEFRKGMSGMLLQMKTFAAESVQMASERDERIRRDTQKLVQDCQDVLKSSATDLAAEMKTALSDASKECIAEISEAARQAGSRQQEQTVTALAELGELRARLTAAETDACRELQERRADVNEALLEFRKGMSGVLREMKAFAAESVQMASELDERIRWDTQKLVQDCQDALRSSATDLAAQMKTALSGVGKESIAEVSEAVRQAGSRQQEQTASALAELGELRVRLIAAEADASQELQERRRQAGAELDGAKGRLDEHNAAMERFIAATCNAADVVEKRILPALGALEKRFKSLSLEKDAASSGKDADSRSEPVSRHQPDDAKKRWFFWRRPRASKA